MTPQRLRQIERHAVVAGNISASMFDELLDELHRVRIDLAIAEQEIEDRKQHPSCFYGGHTHVASTFGVADLGAGDP